MLKSKLVNLESERARRDPNWAPMPFSERIVNTVKVCARRPAVALIVAAPGLGKTRALAHAAAEVPEMVTVTMDPTTASQRAGLSHIREAMAQHDDYAPFLAAAGDAIVLAAAVPMRDIARCFKRQRADGIVPVLVLDEGQYASRNLLDCCRSLYDKGLCSLVVAGNDEFRTDGLAALVSRAAFEISALTAAAADVDAFLDHRGLEDAKARALLHQVAAVRGIRGADEVLRRASRASGPNRGDDVPALAALKAAAATMRFKANGS